MLLKSTEQLPGQYQWFEDWSPDGRFALFSAWSGGWYGATPFYHLNRYLYFASKGDWLSASRHAEPGVEIDRRLATQLGIGPFSGGSDFPFVNGRMYFGKGGQDYFADFGRTGRLVGLGNGEPLSRR